MKKRIFALLLTLALVIGEIGITSFVTKAASLSIDYNESETNDYTSSANKLYENKRFKGSVGGSSMVHVDGYDWFDCYYINVKKGQRVVVLLSNVSGLNTDKTSVRLKNNDGRTIALLLDEGDPYLRDEFSDNGNGEEYKIYKMDYTGKLYIALEKGKNERYYKTYYTLRVRIYDDADVSYRTQVQKQGWQAWKKNGELSGTTSDLRLEAIKIKLSNGTTTGGVKYRTYIQKKGWEKTWATNGAMSGTQGQKLRLEAIQIKLTGNMAKKCSIYYRTYVEKLGWLGWAMDGQTAGTAGYGYKLEGIKILIDAKDIYEFDEPSYIKKK